MQATWAEPIALGKSDTSVDKPAKKEAKIKPPEWIVLESELQSLTTQIRQKQGNLNRLIQEKRSTEDRQKLAEIIRELNSEQRSLKSIVETYDQQRTLLRYRYPERRATVQRKYEKIEVKAIEDLESQTVLDRRLQSARQKVERTFGLVNSEDSAGTLTEQKKGEQGDASRAPASVGSPNNTSTVENAPPEIPYRRYKNTIRLIDETPVLKR